MSKWSEALARTRSVFTRGLSAIFGVKRIDPAVCERIEEMLISADVPVVMVERISRELAEHPESDPMAAVERILLRECAGNRSFSWNLPVRPTVILITGVNGSGKTTTAAKLAYMAGTKGLKPLLSAADTYRAAGADQLIIWADRTNCEVVAGKQGADAASVAYDAVSAAIARNSDVVIIDTAGRMHTKKPLMDELAKTRRAVEKCLPGAPHETWIVLDATLGNNALRQIESFKACIPLTGVVLTKLDGSAKAGFVPAINGQLGLPVLFAGLGEKVEDLVPFDATAFISAILRE